MSFRTLVILVLIVGCILIFSQGCESPTDPRNFYDWFPVGPGSSCSSNSVSEPEPFDGGMEVLFCACSPSTTTGIFYVSIVDPQGQEGPTSTVYQPCELKGIKLYEPETGEYTIRRCDSNGKCDDSLRFWIGNNTPKNKPDLIPLDRKPIVEQMTESWYTLWVYVKNQGNIVAPESVTKVTFSCREQTVIQRQTSAIAVGQIVELVIDVPTDCFGQCWVDVPYTITVDSLDEINESNESNNSLSEREAWNPCL